MSDFDKCNTCGKYDFLDKHECPPIYYFQHEDWGDDLQEIRAYSFKGAAIEFAKLYNEDGDYCLMNEEISVIISDGKGTRKTYIVSAEPDIYYSASEQR